MAQLRLRRSGMKKPTGVLSRLDRRSERGFAAALARVPPEIEPFFHGVGFAIIGPQGFIVHWRGSCGLVVAGSAAGGAGHVFAAARVRLRGCGSFRVRDRWGIGKAWVCWVCVDADAPHVVVLGALSTSANAPPALRPTLGNGHRCWGNIACGFASVVFRQRHRSRRWTAAPPCKTG